MDPCAKFILNRTVNVRAVASRVGPDEVLSAAVEIPAYVEVVQSIGQAPAGTELRTRHLIICETEIKYTDRVWLPDQDPADTNLGRQPESVEPLPGLTGAVDHYEVIV